MVHHQQVSGLRENLMLKEKIRYIQFIGFL